MGYWRSRGTVRRGRRKRAHLLQYRSQWCKNLFWWSIKKDGSSMYWILIILCLQNFTNRRSTNLCKIGELHLILGRAKCEGLLDLRPRPRFGPKSRSTPLTYFPQIRHYRLKNRFLFRITHVLKNRSPVQLYLRIQEQWFFPDRRK